jgi:hypothetical protein
MHSRIWKRLTWSVVGISLVLCATTISGLGGWGCWRCEYRDGGQTEPSGYECVQVGNNAHGVAIYCENINIADIHDCRISGGPCYNVEVW